MNCSPSSYSFQPWDRVEKYLPPSARVRHGKLVIYCCGLAHFNNTLRPTQNGHHFTDDTFKLIFLNNVYYVFIKISLKYFPGVVLSICQHWFRWWLGTQRATSHYLNQYWPNLLTHICFTRPQWVKSLSPGQNWMVAILHTIFSDEFSSTKMNEFPWKFHWSLWIIQH